jgi:methionine biosynthesis protein MetW
MQIRFWKALKKAYAYLFKYFPNAIETLDYNVYWDVLSRGAYQFDSAFSYKVRLISDEVEVGSSVLDIGCGDGSLLEALRNLKNVRGVGIEISDYAIELARKRGVEVIKGDVSNREFRIDTVYDYIIISEVLEHIPNPEEVMLKIRHKFRKNVFISVPNTGHIGDRLRLLLGRFPKQWVLHKSEHLRFWTVEDFICWCRELGFVVEKFHGMPVFYDVLKLPLWKYFPRLFSTHILYKVRSQIPHSSLRDS